MFSYIKHLAYINNVADYKTCAKYIKGGYKVLAFHSTELYKVLHKQ